MSAEDPQSYSSQPPPPPPPPLALPPQWSALQPRQQPLYYPQSQEDPSHLGPQIPISHEHSPNVILSSFDHGPSYDQISQPSSLSPSSPQYPPPDTSQPPYAPYSNPGFSDHQQPPHDYFGASQHAFDPDVRAMTNPSYPAPSVSTAYTPLTFPHQLSELSQAHDYGAQASLPDVRTPDDVAPAFSAINTSFYHAQASTLSNKRQRPEDQEDDAGDVNGQTRGDAHRLSMAEKLKRACARCRGLKVCRSTDVPSHVSMVRL
jgi:hypothetical protein